MKPTVIQANEARTQWADILNFVLYKNAKFIIERRGKPIAVIGPVEEGTTEDKG